MPARAPLMHRRLLALAIAGLLAALGLGPAARGVAVASASGQHRGHRRAHAGARRPATRTRTRTRPGRPGPRRHSPRRPRPRPARRVRAHAAGDPQGNRTLPQATLSACETDPSGPACVNGVLAGIDAARAAEGVRPMRLPADFAALTTAEQLLVVANSERADRGLVPALGLSRYLDSSALAGARAQQDPSPNPFYGDSFGSNWAGGITSALADDFLWMYDDGPGSFNIDCRSPGDPGCWGHRHNILYAYHAPVVMGAAVAGSSVTEVFVGGDVRTRPGQADAPWFRDPVG